MVTVELRQLLLSPARAMLAQNGSKSPKTTSFLMIYLPIEWLDLLPVKAVSVIFAAALAREKHAFRPTLM
jgi:hypothetical protein